MVQLMWPNCNTLQWPPLPEQETSDLAVGKRTMKIDDTQQETPLHKRWKSSSLQTTNEWSKESPSPNSQYNPLNEPLLLGLKLRKSQSLLELLEARLSEAHIDGSKKDVKARVRISGPVDKLKASNFPAVLLRIGNWEYVSKYEGDLVAKCYYAKHKLVWEVLDGGLKNKIEIEWEGILHLKANCPDNGPGTLNIVLGKPPLFFRETDPQPRKHTVWQATTDFTDGEASIYRQHYLQCSQGVLNKHFEKLIHCDTRLHHLSQQVDTFLDFTFAAKYPNELNNQLEMSKGPAVSCIESMSPLGLAHGDFMEGRGYVESWSLVRSKAIALVNAAWPQQTMSVSGIVNHTGSQPQSVSKPAWVLPVSNDASGEANQNQLVENVSKILLTGTPLTTASNEKSPMSGVNSLCGLVQDGNESHDYSNPDADDGNDHFNFYCNPENENAMSSEDDSFTDMLDQLPQIATLPRLFFDTSQDSEIFDFSADPIW